MVAAPRELIKIAGPRVHLFSTDDYLTAGQIFIPEKKFHSTLILGYASIPQEKLDHYGYIYSGIFLNF